ncbi:D-alanine--D-alanine ligase [Microvirga sp. W0021]|uniref:D-alanine--D-alanine ligase n=2 Tax=Hohaiivirga grylli TaxID=3133970 RepID=A0ABV0BHS0_9HYPH
MTKVAVLKGGLSRERDVSLSSGAACAVALKQAGYDVVEIDVGRDIWEKLKEAKPDVCLNALHGPLGEDGSIQGVLNYLGIPYTHSGVSASALAMDKNRTKMIADDIGIPIAKGKLVNEAEFWAEPPVEPYVIKPVNDGSSIDTFVVRDPAEHPFKKGEWPFKGRALLEELIDGTELTCTVLGDRALTVTEIVPAKDAFYNYSAKYAPGGSNHILPARVSQDVLDTCMSASLKIHKALGCRGISRSDFILDKRTNKPVFLEVNNQPGMTPTSLAPEQAAHVGIDFPSLMRILIENAQTD